MDSVKKKRNVNPIAIVFLAILGIFGILQLFNKPI
ncbi:MAG: cytochrome P460, partial [Chryseobacterium sp.]